jgi:hypothetical protein
MFEATQFPFFQLKRIINISFKLFFLTLLCSWRQFDWLSKKTLLNGRVFPVNWHSVMMEKSLPHWHSAMGKSLLHWHSAMMGKSLPHWHNAMMGKSLLHSHYVIACVYDEIGCFSMEMLGPVYIYIYIYNSSTQQFDIHFTQSTNKKKHTDMGYSQRKETKVWEAVD